MRKLSNFLKCHISIFLALLINDTGHFIKYVLLASKSIRFLQIQLIIGYFRFNRKFDIQLLTCAISVDLDTRNSSSWI